MQSLSHFLLAQVASDGVATHDLQSLPRPLAVTYRNADRSLEQFRDLLEEVLGEIHSGYFHFHPNGNFDTMHTLENLAKFNKTQAFTYYCALNKTEKLPELWKKLSESEKIDLIAGRWFVVTYRALQLSQGKNFGPGLKDSYTFLMQCVLQEWEDAFFGLYEVLPDFEQKAFTVYLWIHAIRDPKTPVQQDFCYSILQNLRSREFEIHNDDIAMFWTILDANFARFHASWSSKKLPENLEIELFDEIMKEVVRTRNASQ